MGLLTRSHAHPKKSLFRNHQPLFLFSRHKVALENERKNKLTYTLFFCVVVSMLLLLDELLLLLLLLLFDADD
jgi:hypothetical protein